MRLEQFDMNMPATGANGTAQNMRDLTNCAVVIDGAGAGVFSIKVQMQIGGLWTDLDAGPISASKVVPVAAASGFLYPASAVRIVSTTTGAPAPTAKLVGENHRVTS
jgi:hypothetical protein